MNRTNGINCIIGVMTIAMVTMPSLATDELVENFDGNADGGWGGSSAEYTNPGTGGENGDGDGYLRVANTAKPFNLGVRNNTAPYMGDLVADGVSVIAFYANDIGADDPIELFFGLGEGQSNFWLYNEPVTVEHNEWNLFIVDIANASFEDWTQIGFGASTAEAFLAARTNCTRMLVRHDDSADGFDMVLFNDDFLVGDFGIDRFIIAKGCASDDLDGRDCNGNGVLDECDIADGTSLDLDGDGRPDECGGGSPADFNGDGMVTVEDLLQLLGAWGPCPGCMEDLDGDGMVGTTDLLILLGGWG